MVTVISLGEWIPHVAIVVIQYIRYIYYTAEYTNTEFIELLICFLHLNSYL